MATRINPYQVEPGASGSLLAVDSSGVAAWQASGAASGDSLVFNGTSWIPSVASAGSLNDLRVHIDRMDVFYG